MRFVSAISRCEIAPCKSPPILLNAFVISPISSSRSVSGARAERSPFENFSIATMTPCSGATARSAERQTTVIAIIAPSNNKPGPNNSASRIDGRRFVSGNDPTKTQSVVGTFINTSRDPENVNNKPFPIRANSTPEIRKAATASSVCRSLEDGSKSVATFISASGSEDEMIRPFPETTVKSN